MFTLLKPYDPITWISILVSLVIVPLALSVIAGREESITGIRMEWDTFTFSLWYTFGSFLGETMTSINSDIQTWAVRYGVLYFHGKSARIDWRFIPRIIILVWFMFAFLLTTAYGGILRAFLLKPDFPAAIEDISQVVAAGLPWKLVQYGDWVEQLIAKSEIDFVKKYWAEKVPQRFQDFPFDAVWPKKYLFDKNPHRNRLIFA